MEDEEAKEPSEDAIQNGGTNLRLEINPINTMGQDIAMHDAGIMCNIAMQMFQIALIMNQSQGDIDDVAFLNIRAKAVINAMMKDLEIPGYID